MKYLYFLFAFLPSLFFAQDYSFEILYKGILNNNKIASAHKIKRSLAYGYSSETDKKGEFLHKQTYNNVGYLLSSRWLDKEKNKFVDTDYTYDALNRLTKIVNHINTAAFNYEILVINYGTKNRIESMWHHFGSEGTNKMDTLNFFYNSKGSIDFKIFRYKSDEGWRSDTTVFVYNNDNVLWYSYLKETVNINATSIPVMSYQGKGLSLWFPGGSTMVTVGSYKLNLENCSTKIENPFHKNYIEIERDSLCNMISWEDVESDKRGEVVVEKGSRVYSGKLLVEEKVYKCKASLISYCEELKLEDHLKNSHDTFGLLNQTTWFKDNGKVKRLIKYTYEYY